MLWGSPVRWKDAIHVLEARRILGAVKHRCRDSQRHGKRVAVLNDNPHISALFGHRDPSDEC